MTQPGPHARSERLHPRLTVAHALPGDRVRVAEVLGGAVGSEDLTRAAEELAAERSGDRVALRARLDAAAARALHDHETARSQRTQLEAARQALLDGAGWAEGLHDELPGLHQGVEAARRDLADRQVDQRNARSGLDRVLEQRGAATAAMEEADRKLSELAGAGMDETDLRRELEASGHAVRSAEEAHAAASERLEARRDELAAVEARLQVLTGGSPVDAAAAPVDPWALEQVREALATWEREAAVAEPDPQALALIDAWTDLLADFAELAQHLGPRPSEADLARAEADVVAAAQLVAQLAAAAEAQTLRPSERAAIDAAHDEVLAAEERIDKRFGGGGARKRLEQAREAERALLDQYGFASYLDVALTGGRVATGAPERLAAERAYLEVTRARDELLASLEVTPEVEYLESERARLHAHTVELLGSDPGPDPISALRHHPLLPASVTVQLRNALAVVGVDPDGLGLAEAATRWLAAQDALDEQASALGAAASEVEALRARRDELVAELALAEREHAEAAEALELAVRSVDTFESELSVRVGEDAQRLQRFSAAQQLRSQVEALSTTLARAEGAAREELERTAVALAEAEVAADRLQSGLAEHARHARRLAAELPIDQRPEGEPLATLVPLAAALRSHADVLGPEIARSGVAVAAASDRLDAAVAAAQAASTGLDGPLAEDVHDAFTRLLDASETGPVLLDEPFAGLPDHRRDELLEVLVRCSSDKTLVFLTEDADVLGWAIELPADIATTMPSDTLLTLLQPTSAPSAAGPRVTDPNADSPSATPRWAGQR